MFCFFLCLPPTCIHLYFFAAPTPQQHAAFMYIALPAQPPLKVYECLHTLAISLLCSHVYGSEEKRDNL